MKKTIKQNQMTALCRTFSSYVVYRPSCKRSWSCFDAEKNIELNCINYTFSNFPIYFLRDFFFTYLKCIYTAIQIFKHVLYQLKFVARL